MNVLKKHCSLCIHQFKYNGISYCKKFKYIVIPEYIYPKNNPIEFHIETSVCRKEEELCGKKGNYFEHYKNI